MALFPSLPETPHLRDVFKAFPATLKPLLDYHDALLRGDSPLSIGERELIAAYVSGLNACTFCYGAHKIYAQAFGYNEELIEALVANVETAPVDEKLKPILKYVAKLKTLPPKLIDADAEAVYAAGWSERALYDAVQVAALFNFMNRIIEGTGVSFDFMLDPPTDDEIADKRSRTYSQIAGELGLK